MPDSKVLSGAENVAWKRSHPHQLPAKPSGEEAPCWGRAALSWRLQTVQAHGAAGSAD